MNPNDWLIIFSLLLGTAQGLWVGWYIWRRPQLLRKMKSLQQLLDETPEVGNE
jgi:hypothetical protein